MAGRRVTSQSHLAIERELLDELLGKWCRQVQDAVGPRVSIPAELPEELARLGFDAVRWSEAYRRTARRFVWLARKAEGMRMGFARVWSVGRASAGDGQGGSAEGSDSGGADRCRPHMVLADVRDEVGERSD